MFLASSRRLKAADVAELVDALVSGTSGSNVVGVQVSPSALNQAKDQEKNPENCQK